MTSYNVSNLIDIDSPQMSPQLRFQDFPDQPPVGTSQMQPGQEKYGETTEEPETKSPWSLKYYQKLFDVNTEEVVNRIKWSMVPRRLNYLQNFIQSKPDLYGPFWISVTLVFTIAISGNLANYLQTAASRNYQWKYEFHTVSSAATAIICYAWVLPSILWAYLKWNSSEQEERVSLLELICLYGYCISIYVPVSVLWVIQIGWLQWLLVLLGAALSGCVLVTSVSPRLGTTQRWPLALLLASLHALLAVSFMLYFFHVPSASEPEAATLAPAQKANVSSKA